MVTIIGSIYPISETTHKIAVSLGHFDGFHTEDEMWQEYSKIIKEHGHYSVLRWREAFDMKDEQGRIIVDTTFGCWLGESFILGTIKKMLDIAIAHGKGNMSFKDLINSLESFSDKDEYENGIIRSMISNREDMRRFL